MFANVIQRFVRSIGFTICVMFYPSYIMRVQTRNKYNIYCKCFYTTLKLNMSNNVNVGPPYRKYKLPMVEAMSKHITTTNI